MRKILLAIVENGLNITAAADKLHTSQPGVSKQLKLLEDAEMRPVIDFAISMEEKARDTYRDLAGRVEGDELTKLCHELAEEEQKHFDLLTEARIGADTPIDERPAL